MIILFSQLSVMHPIGYLSSHIQRMEKLLNIFRFQLTSDSNDETVDIAGVVCRSLSLLVSPCDKHHRKLWKILQTFLLLPNHIHDDRRMKLDQIQLAKEVERLFRYKRQLEVFSLLLNINFYTWCLSYRVSYSLLVVEF